MTCARRPSIVARLAQGAAGALLLVSTGVAASPGDAGWAASPDLLTAPVGKANPGDGFTLVQEGGRITVRLEYHGRTITAGLEAAFTLPLGERARLRDPWATLKELKTRKPFANLGWNLWDGRPTCVRAAAPGVVLSRRMDPSHGPVVEIDHGAGLRTRYLLNRYGSSSVTPGTRIAAGEPIGALGLGLPDDIPFVHFGILLDAGGGELVALDPAPFYFTSASHRALPFASSVLNAAVRAQDRDQAARLLKLGLDPNGRAVDGTLPLEWAVMMRDPGMVRLLIASGGDRNAKTAEHIGYFLEGAGMTIANTGPTIRESAQESEDPELIAAVAEK